jgi:hypothetical protein
MEKNLTEKESDVAEHLRVVPYTVSSTVSKNREI